MSYEFEFVHPHKNIVKKVRFGMSIDGCGNLHIIANGVTVASVLHANGYLYLPAEIKDSGLPQNEYGFWETR